MDIDKEFDNEFAERHFTFNIPKTKEEFYYRSIFNKFYLNSENMISHYWMPMWKPEGVTDPSARALSHYNSE